MNEFRSYQIASMVKKNLKEIWKLRIVIFYASQYSAKTWRWIFHMLRFWSVKSIETVDFEEIVLRMESGLS